MSSLLATLIQTTSTFLFQSILIFCIAVLVFYGSRIYRFIDLNIAYFLTGMFTDFFEHRLKASVRIKSETFVEPDKKIPINYKNGNITELLPVEAWLTHYPLDYSLFFDYYIDPEELKASLSRLLSKIPIIGGVYRKIDNYTIGIDHSRPKVSFLHAESDQVPSIDYHDHKNNNWFINYTRGVSTRFPFPEGCPVFKVTLTHYPNPKKTNDKNDKNDAYCSLLSIGCAHAMCDGEAFLMLLRCWTNEMRGISNYEIPEFNRNKLKIAPSELKDFKPQATSLGKYFDHMTKSVSWIENTIWPSRQWTAYTWNFSQEEIEKLKKSALNGSQGEKLKTMIVSTNDIITALFWKLRAVLNNEYSFSDPIICAMVINTRTWLPNYIPKNYFGNALSFLCLSKSRGELVQADLSQVVYWIRETVTKLKKEDLELDLHWYSHVTKHGVDLLHRFYSRWAVAGHNYSNGRYIIDRDMMVSNLAKLPTLSVDFGKGNSSCTRFNFQDDCSQLAYFFKTDVEEKNFEFYSAIPESDVKFYDQYNIKDPNLDWEKIQKEWVRVNKPFIRSYPFRRLPRFDFQALFSDRKDVKFMKW